MIATKEQELKALENIKNIVAELGEGSYLAAAFDGCFELAEQNIDNDFCLSMKEQVEAAEERIKAAKQQADKAIQEAAKKIREAERIKNKFSCDREYWEDIRKSLDWAVYQLSDKLGI